MDPIGAEDGFPDMWIQFGESSRLDYAFNHLGKHSKKIWYFFRNISLTGGPPTLSTFRNKNVTFGQKRSGFQGQKQWPPKFHIKLRNPRTRLPILKEYS